MVQSNQLGSINHPLSFFCVQKIGSNGQRASDDKNNEHAREDAISIMGTTRNMFLLRPFPIPAILLVVVQRKKPASPVFPLSITPPI
jgi:hypothetical protein